MKPGLHDIPCGLFVSRAMADNLAEEIEQADPQGATVLREFSAEVKNIWDRYRSLLPTNREIFLLRERPEVQGRGKNTKEVIEQGMDAWMQDSKISLSKAKS